MDAQEKYGVLISDPWLTVVPPKPQVSGITAYCPDCPYSEQEPCRANTPDCPAEQAKR